MLMDIKETSQLLQTFVYKTDSTRGIQVYNCFIRTLSSLENKDLNDKQSQLIQAKLSLLNLNAPTKNRKKHVKQKLSEFKSFLKEEFSFTSARYFRETWMVYGMIFGSGIGLSIGSAINAGLGTSVGLSIGVGAGMMLGMVYGARKDADAKRLERVV